MVVFIALWIVFLPLLNNTVVNHLVMHPLPNPKLGFCFGEVLFEE